VYHSHSSLVAISPFACFLVCPLNPIAHGSHEIWDDCKGRRVVVRPREVVYPVVNLRVRISSALGSKLEYGPIFAVLSIEEANELIKGVPVGFLRPYRTRTGSNDNCKALAHHSGSVFAAYILSSVT
jgi:hypothetical protein